jgi:diaminohydroxyphosphoribosylaminopyrimidine deaminase/5-amino-6-(5-phosphoribosylamino)uracil reductase
MAEAIALARRGMTTTTPNPRVGCVLAKDNKIIGRGWHEVAGGLHAEAVALEDAGPAASGATAYVTLEPCNHEGRTGPCSELLLTAGVAEVVVAMRDPNPHVSGAGLERLRDGGISTRYGLMMDQARALNPGFVSRMERGRPWVRVKLAQSLDGRTALADGTSQWITGAAARNDVQRWRARACAVLTGVGTIITDNPSLDVRLDDAARQPLRVIVDSRWRTPPHSKTLGLRGAVLIAGREDLEPPRELMDRAECVALPPNGDRVDLKALFESLAAREINEVHVEAGGTLCGALLGAELLDELLLYQASCLLGEEGLASFVTGGPTHMESRPEFRVLERIVVGNDLRMRLAPPYREG